MNTNIRRIAGHLVKYEIWGAVFAVFISMLATDLLRWVVAFLGVFWLLRWIAWGKVTVKTPVDFPIALLVLILPLNYWISPIPEKSLPQLLRLLSGIGFFYAMVNGVGFDEATLPLHVKKRLEGLVWGICFITVGLTAFSLISVDWVSDKLVFIPEKIYSFVSILVTDTVHPNVMAGTLVIFIPVLTGILFFGSTGINEKGTRPERKNLLWIGGDWAKWQKWIFFLANLLALAVLILTQSRGALISYAIVLVGMVCLRWRWGWIGTGIAGLVILWKIGQIGLAKVLDAVLVSATLGGVNGREQIWRRAWYMIQDFPFTGVGMGLFGDVADALYPFANFAPGRIPHAHQLFLQVAVDLGIPGFLAWITILSLIFVSAWKLYRTGLKKNNGWVAGLGAGLLGSQLALCIHGLLDAVTWGMVRPAPLVWGIWGLTVAAWMVNEKL